MTTTKTYNGWTNRATWNLALWLTNDAAAYEWMREHFTCVRPNRRTVQEFCLNAYPNGFTPDGESLENVNWTEIVDMVRESL